jgi:hypothetical protein
MSGRLPRHGRLPWRALRTMPSSAGLNGLTCTSGGAALGKEKSWPPSPDPTTCRGGVRRREPAWRPFRRADLSGVVMRAVDMRAADIDAPWLFDGDSFFRVNGVDVIPLVEAQLNRRLPGRAAAAPQIPMACAPPEPRSSGRGRHPRAGRNDAGWHGRCFGRRPVVVTRRRCGTWSWPPTHGWARRSWTSHSRSAPRSAQCRARD